MKKVLALAITILAGAAFAQTASANTDHMPAYSDQEIVILWEKLMIAISGETEAETLEQLRSFGISSEGALALKAFRTRANVEMANASRWFYGEVCARKKEIREYGGPEMLAQIIEQERQRTSDTRRRLLAEANSLLSLADQERLENFYTSARGPKIGITELNIAARVRNGEVSVEQATAGSCELASHQNTE